MFRFAQHDNFCVCYFLSLQGDSRSNLTSLNARYGWLPRSHVVLARNDPPPAPSAREGEMEAGFSRTHCIIASERGSTRAQS